MSADLRNFIHSWEPQKILSHILFTQRTGFLKRQAMALTSKDPVPPYVEKLIASLITTARVCQPTVQFVAGTNQMEASVRSYTNGSFTRVIPRCRTRRGRPRSLSAVQRLALTLFWYRTSGSCVVFSMLLGITASFCSICLQFGR